MSTPIYLDHAATTPMRPEAIEALSAFLSRQPGNASSVHRWGRDARAALEDARERVAGALGARPREIVFTSGGTEANNLALLGRWRYARRHGARAVVCSAIEHSSVLAAAEAAAAEGAELILLGVDEAGRVDPDSVGDALASPAAVVSVMWGNNEVGIVQPVAEVAARCRAAGAVFHTDAVQAFGKVATRPAESGADLVTVSGHKLGGPTGVGALFVREGVELDALVRGGGQENARRPGTENVAGIVAFARAAELAAAEAGREAVRLVALRDRLEAGVRARFPEVAVNGDGADRLPHVSSLRVPGVERETVIMALDLEGIAASAGSACRSGSVEASHVLVAMGRDEPGTASIRFSLGRTTTAADIEAAVERVAAVVGRVRALAEL